MYSKVSIIKIISSTQKVCSQEGVAAAHLNRYLFYIRLYVPLKTACAVGCQFDTITKAPYYAEKMETSSYCAHLLNEEYNAKINFIMFMI